MHVTAVDALANSGFQNAASIDRKERDKIRHSTPTAPTMRRDVSTTEGNPEMMGLQAQTAGARAS
jgi:hypothetical protein